MTGTIACATLLAACLAAPACVMGQASGAPTDDDRERAFVESLRREDPVAASRYVVLRDARANAVAELERAETQYRAAGPDLRSVFMPRLTNARRKYAETSLALLEFLDERDRQAIARYQEEISRINAVLERHRQSRTELEKLLAE